VERRLHTGGVTGSIPVAPTIESLGIFNGLFQIRKFTRQKKRLLVTLWSQQDL